MYKIIYSKISSRFSDTFYIDATNQQTLEADLAAITPTNGEQSVDASKHWLATEHSQNWLLFFDNADDVQLNLATYFPKCKFGNILITTRNPQLSIHADQGADAKVADMNPEDAKSLLMQMCRAEKTDENEKLAAIIVKVLLIMMSCNICFQADYWNMQNLYYFPLTISQAGAYILHCCSLKQYQELYQENHGKLLQIKEIQKQDKYEFTVYTTWKLSYDKLKPPAKTLLEVLSFLHHEGITEEIFKRASLCPEKLDDLDLQIKVTKLLSDIGKQESTWNALLFQELIGDIRSYSLIEFDNRNLCYRVHPLVQQWSAWTLGPKKKDIQKCVLSIIGLSISWNINGDNYKYRHILLQHINTSIAAIEPNDIDVLVAKNISYVYFEHGQWSKAKALEAVVMEKTRHALGENHLYTLTSMANLAATYKNQGRWKEAEALEVVVMEKKKHLLGEGHPDTLTSMANLAVAYRKQSKWKEAEALEVLVIEKTKHAFGEEHPNTLTSIENLAATYSDQGRWKEAEALEVVVIEKIKHTLGEEHPNTLTSMVNLAAIYSNQRQWKEAEALEVVVMEKKKHLLGEEHPDTMTSMANLAVVYRNQGQWKKAEALEVVVMEKRMHALGEEHPSTLMSMANLAATYSNQGRWEEAEALEVVVIEKKKHLLGEEHPDTLTSMANLIVVYRKQGQWKKAEALEVVVIEKRKHTLGEKHPDTLASMANLAATYSNQGRWKEAEALEVVVIEKKKHLLGEEHSDTLKSMANLAVIYRKQSKWKEAEALEIVVMEKKWMH